LNHRLPRHPDPDFAVILSEAKDLLSLSPFVSVHSACVVSQRSCCSFATQASMTHAAKNNNSSDTDTNGRRTDKRKDQKQNWLLHY